MEPDRIRRRGRDGSGQCGAGPATHHALLRAARSPPPHTRSRWDNSGTKPAAGARFRPGIHEPAGSEVFPKSVARRQSPRDSGNFLLQLDERRGIRGRKSPDHEIDSANSGWSENPGANQLAQSSLQLVPLHRRLAVLRDHQSQSRKAQRGGGGSDVEMLRPPPPPRLSHTLKLGTGSDPLAARITVAVTLQRTSKAV